MGIAFSKGTEANDNTDGRGAEDVQFIEFFAGVGNLHAAMMAAGHISLRYDLLDHTAEPSRSSNYMDLASVSGFA